MKKLLIFSNVLTLLVVLLFVGCRRNNETGEDEATEGHKVPNAQTCYPAVTENSQFAGLNAVLVYELAKNYKNNQLAAINSSMFSAGTAAGSVPTDGDARSVWFDLETLKRFIFEIESQTCGKCNNNSSKHLGIRIYYGTYPDTSAWNDTMWQRVLGPVPMAYAGKHTVMMVPTYRDGDANIDFDPKQVDNNCDFTNIETFYTNMKTAPPANVTLTVLSGINGTAQNHGELMPPPFTGAQIINKGAGIMFAADTY